MIPQTFFNLDLQQTINIQKPERTSSPLLTSRGSDSPVKAAVLTLDFPDNTRPSSGTFLQASLV